MVSAYDVLFWSFESELDVTNIGYKNNETWFGSFERLRQAPIAGIIIIIIIIISFYFGKYSANGKMVQIATEREK